MTVTDDEGHREVSATKARALGRKGVIVGDRVRVVGDTSGGDGTLARIVEVVDRATVLRRTADDDDPYDFKLTRSFIGDVRRSRSLHSICLGNNFDGGGDGWT